MDLMTLMNRYNPYILLPVFRMLNFFPQLLVKGLVSDPGEVVHRKNGTTRF
jgi:hypothetical protein